MLDRLTASLDFQGKALALRAERQQVLAANIANADTPGYQARDIDFAAMLQKATGVVPPSAAPSGAAQAGPTLALAAPGGAALAGAAPRAVSLTDARHLGGAGAAGDASTKLYRIHEQASADANSVDMDRERANFADNAVRYEATLRFINGGMRQMLSAIRGD